MTPAREWWTAAELAEAELPGLPRSKRRISDALADLRAAGTGVRRRRGAGGGTEYHWRSLPGPAQAELVARARREAAGPAPAPGPDRDAAWEAWDRATERARDLARARLECLQDLARLEEAGLCRKDAIRQVCAVHGVSERSVYNWSDIVASAAREDWLAHLLPRHRAGRAERRREVDPEFGELLKSDYLRPEQPSFAAAWRRACLIARDRGIEIAPQHTARRWYRRNVSKISEVYLRKGAEALRRIFPSQERLKSALRSLEIVNGDYHRFDVFVAWPGRPGEAPEIVRPQMVAFQDVYSGKILAWRVDVSANARTVQLCFGDLVEAWGIPDKVLLDNGREFAAKLITGGAPNRYRFKVRDDDVPGLMTALGCEILWATPYSGQSKPIERAFRDLCDTIAKDPRLAGAYTGNRPDAKPENYRSRAVPLDEFLGVVAQGIEEHNARPGRRSEVAFGRSFDAVFEESYTTSPIKRATAAQRRLWLMGAEGVRPNSQNGQISFMGSRFWAAWLYEYRGQALIARFDQADLFAGLHLYSQSGEYLGHAECQVAGEFRSVEGAQEFARARNAFLRAEKAAAKAHRKLTAAQLGEQLDEAMGGNTPAAEPPSAQVVRIMPDVARARTPGDAQPDPAIEAEHRALVADFEARRRDRQAPDTQSDKELFFRALDLERAKAGGERLTDDQARWLISYQQTAAYKGWRDMLDAFGEEAIRK